MRAATRTAALLAPLLRADLLLDLTDAPSVAADYGSAFVRPILQITPAELRSHPFDPSTMGPKVESACRFVEQTGKRAVIGAVADAAAMCAGEAGTHIVAVESLGAARISAVPDAFVR